MSEEFVPIDRIAIREFVARHYQEMLKAAGENRLPFYRLDLRDEFEAAHERLPATEKGKALSIFDQEIETACQQLRVGGQVVSQQIERQNVEASGPGAWIGVILLTLIAGFMGFAIAGSSRMPEAAGTFLIFGSLIGGFFVAKTVLIRKTRDF